MDKAITTLLFTLAGLTAMVAVFNPLYGAVTRGAGALVQSSQVVNQRVKTMVSIVYVFGELDSNGNWVDTAEPDDDFDVVLWVKNTGVQRLVAIEEMDIFFGQPGDFRRIPYVGDAGGTMPHWTYQIENGAEWLPTATLKVVLHFSSPLAPGLYLVRVVTPNGVAEEREFSM